MARRPAATLADLFWPRVHKTAGCWVWTGALGLGGYGHVRGMGVHRVSYLLAHGELPAGLDILHRCVFAPCVNPAHLYAGTAKDNARDAREIGHWGSRVCSEAQALEAAALFAAGQSVGLVAYTTRISVLDAMRLERDGIEGWRWTRDLHAQRRHHRARLVAAPAAESAA